MNRWPRTQEGRVDRFWSLVEKTASCWIFNGHRDPKGYGRIRMGGRQLFAHRVAWGLLKEERLVPTMTLDHLCRNPSCVNPDHLEQVTNTENVLRGNGPVAINKRRTHCVNGHPFDDTNTFICKSDKRAPRRMCRACLRERRLRYKGEQLRA